MEGSGGHEAVVDQLVNAGFEASIPPIWAERHRQNQYVELVEEGMKNP